MGLTVKKFFKGAIRVLGMSFAWLLDRFSAFTGFLAAWIREKLNAGTE